MITMKRNVIVNEYSVRIDNYDKEGNPTTSQIFYDGGDYEWINNLEGIRSFSFYYLSNNRGVRGYEYCDGVRYLLSDLEFQRYI